MSVRTNRIITTLIAVFVLVTIAPTFTGKVIYVDDDGPADFSNIQAAIDAAEEGDEIIVSIGTYYENISFCGKSIALRSTEPKNPVAVANTIIDGRLGGSVVTFSGMESSSCVLSGFTITNGRGTGVGFNYGGGIYGNGTLATIQSNIISGNRTASPLCPCSGFGGGIYDCDGIIQCNIISDNFTSGDEGEALGGGLYGCDGIIRNNIISGNWASSGWGGYGGGIANCNGTIQNNTIFGNLAGDYGGGLSGCNGTIINCIIWQNTAAQEAQISASSTPSYSCIQDWSGGGAGNISDNPRLVDPESDDFHLQTDSPCIDIGTYIPGLTEDFEGDLRPLGSGYDIGADEFISDNFSPDKPTNISPAKGAINISLTPTLKSSAFSDPDIGDSHQASQWHVWISGTTLTVFASTKSSGDLLTVTIPPRTLSDDITYYWRVRYQDNQGAWSYWSDPTEFTTEDTGEVVTVPGDYPTIQAAIDAAIYGDEIVVSQGMYVENINFRGKNIILRSTDPKNSSIVAGTIIDGNRVDSVVAFIGTEPASCILSGFTITNGRGTTAGYNYGGGIYGNGTLATIQNNIIYGNIAQGSVAYGGGLCECNGTIQYNIISGNSVQGGYYAAGGGLYKCHGAIHNNLIMDNSATSPGGSWDGSGGGLAVCGGVIENNIISNNSTGGNGGGLISCNGTVQKNIISGNSSNKGGGGLCQCHGTIQNNVIIGNSAQGLGGGLYYIYGGIIRNNTIVGNSSGAYGGGLSRCIHGDTIIRNCIIWGNTAEIEGDQLDTSVPPTYSCIESWTSGGTGNIDSDPCFVQPGYWDANGVWIDGDYHLLPDSPCINAGDPNHSYDPNETDLDGKPRIIAGRIDMGTYETPIPAEARIIPRTINLNSKGKWITCYIWLPEGYDVADIDPNSVFLDDEIQPEQLFINEQEQVATAIFIRQEVQAILNIGEVELTINAQLTDATYFEGTDVIKVIREGGGKLAKFVQASNPYPADGATNVDTTADLSWTASPYATSHNVYFGTGSQPPFVCNQTATTFDPSPDPGGPGRSGRMAFDKTYYWHIDEVSKWGITTGQLWRFTTLRDPGPPGTGTGTTGTGPGPGTGGGTGP